ncbi:hypothetical protein QQM79_01470 [Marinobacteraceae bacterium S3BR75-40.1]
MGIKPIFCRLLLLGLLSIFPVVWAAPTGTSSVEEDRRSLTDVEGISVRASDEQPKVLNIVPWKPPTIQRRAKPELRTDSVEPVIKPIDPEAFQTHRRFRQSLDVLDSRGTGR